MESSLTNGQETEDKKAEVLASLKENAIQIGGDVKMSGAPEGLALGFDYADGQYATNNGWVNFKDGGTMYAVFMTDEVASKLNQAGFKKVEGLGVVDNNPDRFHAGAESSTFKSMVGQVGNAHQMERNKDEKYLSDEAFAQKYGEPKPAN